MYAVVTSSAFIVSAAAFYAISIGAFAWKMIHRIDD